MIKQIDYMVDEITEHRCGGCGKSLRLLVWDEPTLGYGDEPPDFERMVLFECSNCGIEYEGQFDESLEVRACAIGWWVPGREPSYIPDGVIYIKYGFGDLLRAINHSDCPYQLQEMQEMME